MADDGQVRIGIYVDNEGVKSSMDAATKTVKDGTKEMSEAAKEAGKDIGDKNRQGRHQGNVGGRERGGQGHRGIGVQGF